MTVVPLRLSTSQNRKQREKAALEKKQREEQEQREKERRKKEYLERLEAEHVERARIMKKQREEQRKKREQENLRTAAERANEQRESRLMRMEEERVVLNNYWVKRLAQIQKEKQQQLKKEREMMLKKLNIEVPSDGKLSDAVMAALAAHHAAEKLTSKKAEVPRIVNITPRNAEVSDDLRCGACCSRSHRRSYR